MVAVVVMIVKTVRVLMGKMIVKMEMIKDGGDRYSYNTYNE